MPSQSQSIYECFSGVAKARYDEPAIFFKRDGAWRNLKFSEIYCQSVSLGNLLYSRGIRPSDKVAIMLGNQPEWPVSFMAIQYAGGVAVPIDMNLSVEDIKKQVEYSGARVILSTEKMRVDLSAIFPDLKIFLVDSEGFRNELKAAPFDGNNDVLKAAGHITDDTVASLFYSSGTTAAPKAIMLTHKNLLSNLHSFREMNMIKPGYVFISFLPLHHTYSFMVTCLVPLLEGGHISYPAMLNSEEIINCIKATKVNVLTGVPRFFDILHRNVKAQLKKKPLALRLFFGISREACWLVRKYFKINLSRKLFSELHHRVGDSLNYMISGGARLEPEIIYDLFKWGFAVMEGYGLTETAPVVTFNAPSDFRIESVGRTIPGVEIKIMDPDSAGIGEIAIRGPNVMAGYYKQPEETGRVIRDGWFSSGDLGYLDKDGYLYIKVRKDEMLVLGSGKKVNPEEIEAHYGSSPYIKEVCLLGTFMLVVVPDEEYFRKTGESNVEEKIRSALDSLSHSLSPYKRIRGFVIRKEPLWRTAMGKLMRRRISDESSCRRAPSKAAEELSAEDAALLSSETCQKALKFISEYVKKKSVNLNDNLELDLGLDSLGKIELLMELGQFLKIELSEADAMELFYANTVKELMLKSKEKMFI